MSFLKLLTVVLFVTVAQALVPSAGFGEPAADVAPFTVLFDTGKASTAPLAIDALSARSGWMTVPEDNLTHPFTGDAVFMNDRVAVVLRANGDRVEMYSRSHSGFIQRAQLLPLGVDGGAAVLSSVKIIENSQAAVMIQAVMKTQGGATALFGFRLSAGEGLLDMRGGKGAGRLRVCDQSKYVVVPDFFADDMVFDASAVAENRVGLPADSSVLGLTDNGRAIVACVWPSSRQNVGLLIAGEGPGRTIAGYEIDLLEKDRLWIAVMEGTGVWHARVMSEPKAPSIVPTTSSQKNAELGLEWQPPIPARWRADFVAAGGAVISTSFADTETDATGARSNNQPQCRFDSGRALVRLADSAGPMPPRLIVIYPIARTRTTPLTAFCLVDIMRNALGVGPCQYVLDAERIGTTDNSTPEPVTHWIEKQFEKKPSKRDTDAIGDQLAKMTLQVKRTDLRIGDYVAFGQKIRRVCADHAKSSEIAPAAGRLLAITDTMTPPAASTAATVEKLAADVAAQAEKPDALAKTQAAITMIRSAGAEQDYALAKLRMATRRLKQEARTIAVVDSKAAAFAGEIQQQAEQMLVKK